MSVELNFWRYKENSVHHDELVYRAACCDGNCLKELELLPIDAILQKIADTFSGWTSLADGQIFENEVQGAFQIFTTSQIVRFDCYDMQETDMNRLIDILIGFGCPLYDPQTAERFDSWTDR